MTKRRHEKGRNRREGNAPSNTAGTGSGTGARDGQGKGGKGKKGKQPLWRLISENIECLAIAIAMALMLNTFFIQAYKIPTGSMQPTLIGCEDRGLYDRVLVNKCIYLLSDPERWDVAVFKYPLDQSKNYIKRLVGLPGEEIEIKNGDIYVNGRIARKPEDAAGAVLKRIFPVADDDMPFNVFFRVEGDHRVLENDSVDLAGPGTVRTARPIRDNYLDGYDPDYRIPTPFHARPSEFVGDVRIRFDVELHGEEGGIAVKIIEEGKEHRVFLQGERGPEPSGMTSGTVAFNPDPPKSVWSDPGLHLEKGRRYEVVVSNIDDRLAVRIDGEEIAVLEYEDPDPEKTTSVVEFGPAGCGAVLSGIALYRDIYYLDLTVKAPGEPARYEVPEGHYFALGDNTQNSSDSRLWRAVYLTRRDGTEVFGNTDGSTESVPVRTRDGYFIKDHYGDERFLPFSQLEDDQYQVRPEPFVPEKLLLGKAMAIFWPIYPHFRWNLLR